MLSIRNQFRRSIVIRVLYNSIALQVKNFISGAMKDLFGGLAASVGRGAGLALASRGLHIMVLVCFGRHIWITVSQRGYRGYSSGESANRMVRPFEGELPVRNLIRVAPAPARPYTDQV